MSRSDAPEGFEIAALKKKQQAVWNPMAAGRGTPWEDRATHGTLGAFLKTCVASLTRPRNLADTIRRPETTTDARSFVIGCGVLWGISAAGHTAYALYRKAHHPELLPPKVVLDETSTLWIVIDLLVPLVGGVVGILLLWMLFTAVYNRLVQQEARTVKLTEPLIANVTAYAFGPAILAVIPVVGPVLAAVAVLLVMVVMGGSSRVRLRFSAAVIDALLSFLAAAAVGVAGSFILYGLSDKVLPSGVPTVERTANDANQPAIGSSSDR